MRVYSKLIAVTTDHVNILFAGRNEDTHSNSESLRVYSKLLAVTTDHVNILFTGLNEDTHSNSMFSAVICCSNYSVVSVTTDWFTLLLTGVK